VFAFDGKCLEILLIQRKNDPDKGKWAFPGGFTEEDETCEAGCIRELKEETGLEVNEITLSGVYSNPGRDSRGRVISIAYSTLIAKPEAAPAGSDDAEDARWFPVEKLPPLAFDHNLIFQDAFRILRSKVCYKPVGLGILSETFSIEELKRLYEAVLGREINPRTLQRKLMKMNYLKKNDNIDISRKSSAKLLSFDPLRYNELLNSGFWLNLNEKE
jgi:8-oxo-dGTP diphosphatase